MTGDQVLLPHGRFADPVTIANAARHDDERRQPLVIERQRMIQPGPEHRRGPAVVLRRTEYHDGVAEAALVLPAGDDDTGKRGGIPEGEEQQKRERDATAGDEHGGKITCGGAW